LTLSVAPGLGELGERLAQNRLGRKADLLIRGEGAAPTKRQRRLYLWGRLAPITHCDISTIIATSYSVIAPKQGFHKFLGFVR